MSDRLAGDPVDRMLDAAGARWRATQPDPRPVDGSRFAAEPQGRFAWGRSGGEPRAFAARAAGMALVLVAVVLAVPAIVPRLGGGSPAMSGSSGYIASGAAACPLTMPDRSFTPPAQNGVDWSSIDDAHGWYGSAGLWTLLDVKGETWSSLPRSELGLGQKTFWWRQGYEARAEPSPQIFVKGERLDGPGGFSSGPGTNASFGLGSAMLVGIDVPEAGCWKLTAEYYAERLSIVVWVAAD